MKDVFIVDDNLDILHLYERTFHLSGYGVKTADNGRGACNELHCSKSKPDIILLDIMMPGFSGFDVLKFLKDDDGLKTVPVMALTNLVSLVNEEDDLKRIRSLGAVDVIIKSDIDPETLVERVGALIGK